MHKVVIQQATFTGYQRQTTGVMPGHGTGLESQAINDNSFQDSTSCDEPYQQQSSRLMLVLSVLANVIGGSLLLSVMFFLPHLIAGILI